MSFRSYLYPNYPMGCLQRQEPNSILGTNTSLLSLYKWRVMYFCFIFKMFPVMLMIFFFFLAFEVNAIDRIRIFVITSWLPSFHKQEFKTQYSVSHSTPSSVSFFLIVIMATYHPLPEFLPILVTSVLFNKIQCITYSFQLNTWEKKKKNLETTAFLCFL